MSWLGKRKPARQNSGSPASERDEASRRRANTALADGEDDPSFGAPKGEDDASSKGPVVALLSVAGFTILLLAALMAAIIIVRDRGYGTAEVILTPVVLVTVVVLTLAFGGLAIVFKRLGLHDRRAAMGLPQGSIRAVIAIMLIVLFWYFRYSL
jgi:hypothetical protein